MTFQFMIDTEADDQEATRQAHLVLLNHIAVRGLIEIGQRVTDYFDMAAKKDLRRRDIFCEASLGG